MSGSQVSSLGDGSIPDGPTLIVPPAVVPESETPYRDPPNAVKTFSDTVSSAGRDSRIADYVIVREIGRGGMGVVYEAVQLSLNRRVALKVLPQIQNADKRHVLRFQNESRAAAQMHHPNIVPVYAVGTESGLHYYTMQLISGKHLGEVIRQAIESRNSQPSRSGRNTAHQYDISTIRTAAPDQRNIEASQPRSEGGLSVERFPSIEFLQALTDRRASAASRKRFSSMVQIGIQAAEALQYAHQAGIIHRDIKPANLMLDEIGNLWVTDFGLAQFQGAGGLTMTGEVIGTLRYMSPEQALGQRVTVDHRTDIYSLGMTLYELLTLKKAFDGTTSKELIRQVCFDTPVSIRKYCPGVPDDLETIIQKAISKNPDDRYQTAQELADDLRRFADDQPILARRPNAIQKCQRWIRQNASLATAIGGAGMFTFILTLVAIGMIWNSRNAQIILRKKAETLLDKSEGLRLLAEAATMRQANPGLSLLMTVRGATLAPGVEGNSAILASLEMNHEVRTITPRPQACGSLIVRPDGQSVVTLPTRDLVTAGQSFPAIEFDAATGKELRKYDTGGAITTAAYSPDGKFLLTGAATFSSGSNSSGKPGVGTETNEVPLPAAALWDTTTGSRIQTFPDAGYANLRATSFSPQSDTIALPGADSTIRIYSTADGSQQRILRGHTGHVFSVIFDSEGRRLLSAGNDNTVRIWNLESGEEIHKYVFENGLSDFSGPVFGANSEQIVVVTESGTQLLSAATGQPVGNGLHSESDFAISRNGKVLALFDKYDHQIALTDLPTGMRRPRVKTADRILSVDLSEDGEYLLATTTKEALVFRTSDGSLIATLKGHTDRVVEGRFVPGNEYVLTASNDLTMRTWSIRDGMSRMTLQQNTARTAPGAWSFSSDSGHAIVADRPASYTSPLTQEGISDDLQFPGRLSEDGSSDNQRLVTLDERSVYVTQIQSAQELARFKVDADDRVYLAQGMTGTELVFILLESGRLLSWDTGSQETTELTRNPEKVAWFSLHPQTGRLIVILENGICRLVDGRTSDISAELTHAQPVVYGQFNRTGSRVATIDSENVVRIWDHEAKSVVHTLSSPESRSSRAEFSSDGSVLATWSDGGADRVRFWSTEDGKLLMESAEMTLADVRFHPSDHVAAVTSLKDGIRVFDLAAGTDRQISATPARSPVFQKDVLVSVDGDPSFEAASTLKIFGHSLSPFTRSSVVSRNLMSGEIVSTRSIAGEGFSLNQGSNEGPVLLSINRFDASVVQSSVGRNVVEVGHHSGPIVFQGLAGRGQDLKAVCASLDGSVSISDLSGQLLHRLTKFPRPIMSADLAPDGTHIAVFHDNGVGSLWNIVNGEHLSELKGHTASVQVVRFSPSGRQLLTAGGDSTLHIRELEPGSDRILLSDSRVIDAEWFPDQERILVITSLGPSNAGEPDSANKEQGAFVVDAKSGDKQLLIAAEPLKSGVISPDGKTIGVVTENGKLHLFHSETGARIDSFRPERRPVTDAAFSPDSAEILLRHDAELSLWEIATQTEVCRYPDSDQLYWGGALRTATPWLPFTPDGQWIISATPTLQKWPRDPLTIAVKASPRPFSNTEIQRYGITLLTESGSGDSGND